MKIFHLKRIEDVSGTSGTGKIAEGVEFDNGICVLNWLTATHSDKNFSSICVYPDIKQIEIIHGHEGKTEVVPDLVFYG